VKTIHGVVLLIACFVKGNSVPMTVFHTNLSVFCVVITNLKYT
jgi:hypothetical protein